MKQNLETILRMTYVSDNLAQAIRDEIKDLDWLAYAWSSYSNFRGWMLENCPKDYILLISESTYTIQHKDVEIKMEIDLDETGAIDAWRVYYRGIRVI